MSLGQTQPSKPNNDRQDDAGQTKENRVTRENQAARLEDTQETKVGQPNVWKGGWVSLAMTLILFVGGLLILVSASGWLGYQSGQETHFAAVTKTMDAYLAGQYAQAVDDITQENYSLALERLGYILSVIPDFKPAQDLYADVSSILNVTATPAPPTSTPTVSPTPDLRPAEEMYDSVLSLISIGEWNTALDTLANLRKANPSYNIVEVDGLIFLSLRNRGVEKILSGDLEGGIYDFSLAEQFGPLDAETESYRGWARLYLLGNAFWGAYPEQAAYYYGQLVSAAPSITDASGVSAFYRYWASLVQIAENLAKEEKWCDAYEQMKVAQGAWDQASVQPTAEYIRQQCIDTLPTDTPTPTITPLYTSTVGITPGSSTPTFTPAPNTATPTSTSAGPTNTYTSTPTPTFTSAPAETSGG